MTPIKVGIFFTLILFTVACLGGSGENMEISDTPSDALIMTIPPTTDLPVEEEACLEGEVKSLLCPDGVTIYDSASCVRGIWVDIKYVKDPCDIPLSSGINESTGADSFGNNSEELFRGSETEESETVDGPLRPFYNKTLERAILISHDILPGSVQGQDTRYESHVTIINGNLVDETVSYNLFSYEEFNSTSVINGDMAMLNILDALLELNYSVDAFNSISLEQDELKQESVLGHEVIEKADFTFSDDSNLAVYYSSWEGLILGNVSTGDATLLFGYDAHQSDVINPKFIYSILISNAFR